MCRDDDAELDDLTSVTNCVGDQFADEYEGIVDDGSGNGLEVLREQLSSGSRRFEIAAEADYKMVSPCLVFGGLHGLVPSGSGQGRVEVRVDGEGGVECGDPKQPNEICFGEDQGERST